MSELSVHVFFLAFVTSGMCYGFDVEKYVQDHNELYNFVRDVNAAEKEMLSKDTSMELFRKTEEVINLGEQGEELIRNMLFRPATDKVYVSGHIVQSVSYDSGFSWTATKREVVQEMIKREAAKKLERYGIEVVDGIDVGIPMLRLQATIKDARVDGRIIYLIHSVIELHEVLNDPVTQFKIIATTWNQSNTAILVSDENLEDSILRAQSYLVDDFIRNQYGQCVLREAKQQLEQVGKLLPYLVTQPVKRD